MPNKPPFDPRCSRCKQQIPNSWEWHWPLYGTLDVGFPAQAFGALGGMKHCAEKAHFIAWDEGHPALKVNEAQHIVFAWTDKAEYHLCYDCQKELLSILGKFFGIQDRVKEIEKDLNKNGN